ncbi:MAG: hypothetical protein LBU88_00630 [Treponema sp.]|jgi:hypothetical protein|nr:hypothetical protein [Treponema sp.]
MYKRIRVTALFVLLIISGAISSAISSTPAVYSQDFPSPEFILGEMNNAFKAGTAVDYGIVSACIAALMEQGSSSSYPALFSVLTSGYPEIIASEAIGALDIISGNLNLFLLNVIENNPPAEKFIAFRTGINSQKLNVSERGQLAEHALEKSFLYNEEDADLTALRYASILALTELEWKRANAQVIRHYYRVQADFMQNRVSKDRLIEAIACLGAVGDSDAALVLVLQLGLINARKERTGTFDSEITMAVINALGNIGDNAAFDNLLFAGNLSYNEDITSAAAEAISRLKW